MMSWKMLITEFHRYGQCAKLKGEQSSGDWNVAGRTVWKRAEMAWMSLKEGFVVRLERNTEWRTESGELWKSTLVAELDSMPANIPSQQFQDRRRDVLEAVQFAKELAELMKPRGEPDFRGYDSLLRRMEHSNSRGTPYAAAIQSLHRRAEQARNGERPPEPLVIRTRKEPPKPAEDGEPAPDFSASDFAGGPSLKLSQLRGQPTVLVFFKPTSKLASRVLKYVQSTMTPYAGRVHVIALASEADLPALLSLRNNLKIKFPIYDGRAALSLFTGRSTPRTIVIDKSGMVTLILHGWNGEFPELIHKELLKLVK
jgi:hypothetical protein